MIIKRASSDVTDAVKLAVADQDDPEILQYFKKTAADLKAIAPRAKDFLYFTCIMMHAAEASALDSNGSFKKLASGEDVFVGWDENAEGALIWKTNDPSIKPFKNNNSDIFPEQELKKAYKQWVGKPLCLDHQSSSVDMVRGIIVDTVYDEKFKRIIALCAIDKVNYPDLARKVASGYAASVSMGTAVGRAVCTEVGCHKVARIEPDFCVHMRNRSGYGEINRDLNPIELSIVVNPADPGAKIRRVVAQSNSVAQYIENKIANNESIESETDDLSAKIADMQNQLNIISAEIINNNSIDNKKNIEIKQLSGDNLSLNSKGDIESSKFAQEMNNAISSLKDNLNYLTDIMSKVAFNKEEINNKHKDNEMSKKEAYFNGGGGVNEPTPKQVKYPKEEADSIRNTQDKQMVGQMDTGPVDGMHPGYDSFGESEEARKKRLQRLASREAERKLRREAAVEKAKEALRSKEAYFNGGGDVNEPTPGKPKYPKEDSDKIREKDDKQMNGAAPFPGVGDVEGLYGDDEAKKEKLSRASKLSARFVRASKANGSDDLANSRWDIYAEDSSGAKKLVFSTTVSELAGTKVAALYPAIATETYGAKIMKTIRTAGVKAASEIYKSAQVAPQAVASPVDVTAPVPAPMDAMPQEVDSADYSGESGTSSDEVKKLVHELGNLHADLEKAVDSLEEEASADVSAEMPVATASVSIQNMGRVLRASLIKGMKAAMASLSEVKDELGLIDSIYEQGVDSKSASIVNGIVKEATVDAEKAKKNAFTVMASFVRYAKGVEELKKQAQVVDPFGAPVVGDFVNPAAPGSDASKLEEEKKQQAGMSAKDSDSDKDEDEDEDEEEDEDDSEEEDEDSEEDNDSDEESEDKDENDVVKLEGDKLEGSPDEVASVMNKLTASEREILRLKLAQKGVQFSDMLGKAHKGGVKTKLDVKVTGDLDKVETLEEVHKRMEEVALAGVPKNVRMAADQIQTLVAKGEIDPASDFPGLIAEGLDSAAVSYWKKLYGEAKDPASSKFVTELVKDFKSKKAADDVEAYKVKYARAYDLTMKMASKGLISDDTSSVRQQVEKVMGYNDENFEHFASTIERMRTKKASMPEVGLRDSMSEYKKASQEESGEDLVSQLSQLFNTKSSRKGF